MLSFHVVIMKKKSEQQKKPSAKCIHAFHWRMGKNYLDYIFFLLYFKLQKIFYNQSAEEWRVERAKNRAFICLLHRVTCAFFVHLIFIFFCNNKTSFFALSLSPRSIVKSFFSYQLYCQHSNVCECVRFCAINMLIPSIHLDLTVCCTYTCIKMQFSTWCMAANISAKTTQQINWIPINLFYSFYLFSFFFCFSPLAFCFSGLCSLLLYLVFIFSYSSFNFKFAASTSYLRYSFAYVTKTVYIRYVNIFFSLQYKYKYI